MDARRDASINTTIKNIQSAGKIEETDREYLYSKKKSVVLSQPGSVPKRLS